MNGPTRAELAEQNAALRELLAAVAAAADVPNPERGKWDEHDRLQAKRITDIQIFVSEAALDSPGSIRTATRLLRQSAADVPYRATCGQHLKELEGYKTCQLDPGHDGDHSPERARWSQPTRKAG